MAASNSIRVFGKVLNTALSVSYGSADELEELPEIPRPIHGGAIVRPLNDANDSSRPVNAAADSGAEVVDNKIREVVLNVPPPPLTTLQTIRQNFLKNHNTYVTRVNNKYLREGSMARHV
uniref:Uncharacterized protein n=1 Tax=Triatoma infestans TaxID=30076 RepID=A0A161MG32_TRIIF